MATAVVARPRSRRVKVAPLFSDWQANLARSLGNGFLLTLFMILMWWFA